MVLTPLDQQTKGQYLQNLSSLWRSGSSGKAEL
jgi:hypothetical protein